jgi:hypothetical protein
MFFAIAALFLNLSPSVQALPDTTIPAVTKTVPASTPVKPEPRPASSTNNNSTEPAPAILNASSYPTTEENSQSLSTIRVPEVQSEKSAEVIGVERTPSRRTWLLLAIAEHSAATFDAYSTRQAVSKGAVEDDPFMRPFAHSDALYAAIQVAPFLFDYTARRMQHSQNNFIRKTWWIPQSASTGLSLFSGVHNLHVAARQ